MIALVLLLSPIFPGTVESHLGLTYTPQCTLCHETLAGGFGTATQPFGVAVMSRGAVAGNTATLEIALDALDAENRDSDGDTVSDIDELRAGTNPNGAEGPEPEFGCFGRIGDGGPSLASVLLAIGAFVGRRKSR